jgi:hypothetical protein
MSKLQQKIAASAGALAGQSTGALRPRLGIFVWMTSQMRANRLATSPQLPQLHSQHTNF